MWLNYYQEERKEQSVKAGTSIKENKNSFISRKKVIAMFLGMPKVLVQFLLITWKETQ